MPSDPDQLEAMARRIAARLAIAHAILTLFLLPSIALLAAWKAVPSIIVRIAQ